MLQAYFPVLLLLLFAVGFAVFTIILSQFIGKKKPTSVKLSPYECGIKPIGTARIQFSVRFYVVALLFLLFDMETIFILTWAVVFHDKSIQLFALIEMVVFIAILLVGYAYVWKKGALKWR
jgi:NADH-quinone oxidoreductase subunit A